MKRLEIFKNFINGERVASYTGNGHREACVQALEVFSEWKSVFIDFSGVMQRAQIDNQ